jgi:redox-sensitive bicupin YhaK (pirin superfamily)
MIQVHKAQERGSTRLPWLDSRHSFSFGDYYDPDHMGFRALRVINDDRVAPAGGFGTHGHRDMEIITYVLDGALEHRDSLGTGSVIAAGDVQKMSAGTGIRHSEFNHSKTAPVHFLQIWVIPEQAGLTPEYQQITVQPEHKRGQLHLIAAREAGKEVIRVHQDLKLYDSVLESPEQEVSYALDVDRYAWLHVARGAIEFNGNTLSEGDGAAVFKESELRIKGAPGGEFLLFDLG